MASPRCIIIMIAGLDKRTCPACLLPTNATPRGCIYTTAVIQSMQHCWRVQLERGLMLGRFAFQLLRITEHTVTSTEI